MCPSSEKIVAPISMEKFRSNFRHDLRSGFSVLIGFGEVLREDLSPVGNSIQSNLDHILSDARALLDDTMAMINHCSTGALSAFKTEVKAGLRKQTIPELRKINERISSLEEHLASLEDSAGKLDVLSGMLEAIRHLLLRCHSPFEQKIELPEASKLSAGFGINTDQTIGERRGHVLVLDDELHNLHLISTFLGRLNLTSATFTNGADALHALENEKFDLILLDLHMPQMSGLEVLKEIKKNPKIDSIPILVVTASDDADELAECIEAGAIDSLTKPFQSAFLKARVLTSLTLQEAKKREQEYAEELRFQKNRIEELLAVILPREVIDELQATGEVQPRRHEHVCVLFCDIVNFTRSCDSLSPEVVLSQLQSLFSEFEVIAELHGLQKIKTIGDSFMAVVGLAGDVQEPERVAARAGLDLISCAANHNSGWQVRVGIHSGPVVSGLVGSKQFLFDIWGDTVNTAARIEGAGQPQTLTASKSAFERLGANVRGRSLGLVSLKGKGEQEVFVIEEILQKK
ncbi:adenylate/guanylate cyclase domain-containing response regulator [bacterium]|nr:adenylate/guanylate cyclase domain-containing response regulator [bacterium]